MLPSSLSEEEKRFVLAHERAHLRRLDHVWKPLGFLLLAVHWFNPLVWLGYRLLCRDIEAAYDEEVIRRKDKAGLAAYSQALLDCSFQRAGVSACPLAFGEVGVKQRVRSVLGYKKPKLRVLLAAAVLCALTALSVLIPNTGDYLRLTAASGAENAAIEETLAAIPAGDSVTASTMFIPRLADRRTLYEVFYHQLSTETRTDWLILDCRYGDYERFLLLYENWGYTLDREVTVGDRPVRLVLRLAA